MARQSSTFKIQRYKTYLQVQDSGYIYFGDDKDANFYADGTGFRLTGAVALYGATQLGFAGVTLTPDANRTYRALHIGNRTTAKTITIGAGSDQNLDPIQLNLLVAGVNPGNSSTLNASYMLITHSTAMANMRLKCADWNVAVSANVKDAYVYQGEINITGALTISGECCVSGLVMNAQTGTITGRVVGQIIVMRGAYLPATSYGLWIATESSAVLTHAIDIETQLTTTITNGIRMGNAATFTNAISIGGAIVNFLNLSEAGNDGFVTTGAKGSTVNYTLKVIAPDGQPRYINLYSAA